MKNSILILSFTAFLFLNACGQKSQNDLIGTWELDKKDNGVDEDFFMLPIEKSEDSQKSQEEPEIILKFNENSIVDFKQGSESFKANYSRKKNNLTLGSTKYKILKLDSDSLIIVEEDGLMPTTFYYFKSDREFDTVKEYENVEEKYSNGQLKTKGIYHNGFEDGLWEEWFENGQKKSERKFKDGIPTGTWKEWDENGKLISEREMK